MSACQVRLLGPLIHFHSLSPSITGGTGAATGGNVDVRVSRHMRNAAAYFLFCFLTNGDSSKVQFHRLVAEDGLHKKPKHDANSGVAVVLLLAWLTGVAALVK